uniref:pectinesterase-like n=1 Tax=Erigeron canadensis TaxID=72917 RepID=UPI001CB971EA|nr:pectinesterase-like [Erigeron canadensis]
MDHVKKNFTLMGISAVLLAVTVTSAVVNAEVQSGSNQKAIEFLEKGPNDNAWWATDKKRSNLNVDPKALKPNVVVAQDGSGTFSTIMDAVRSVPQNNKHRFIIFIKQGTYMEYVDIPDGVDNVVFIGEGPTKTRISGSRSYDDVNDTYRTATVGVNGAGFMAKGIGFENTSGPLKHQAVALRVSGDRAIFNNCAIDGYQDALYAESQRQFYRHCTIRGTVDFIFGDAQAVFQDCKIIVRKPLENQVCVVTAQGRSNPTSKGALIIQGCTITAEPAYMATNPMPKSYLGRPWGIYSTTIIMQSFIDRNIDPEGWSPWDETRAGLDTCHYAEFDNRGPGANTAQRVNGKGIKKISPQEADSYTPGKYINGGLWIKPARVPYDPGMMNVYKTGYQEPYGVQIGQAHNHLRAHNFLYILVFIGFFKIQ